MRSADLSPRTPVPPSSATSFVFGGSLWLVSLVLRARSSGGDAWAARAAARTLLWRLVTILAGVLVLLAGVLLPVALVQSGSTGALPWVFVVGVGAIGAGIVLVPMGMVLPAVWIALDRRPPGPPRPLPAGREGVMYMLRPFGGAVAAPRIPQLDDRPTRVDIGPVARVRRPG